MYFHCSWIYPQNIRPWSKRDLCGRRTSPRTRTHRSFPWPRGKMVFSIAERVVIYSVNGGGSGKGVYDSYVHARCAFQWSSCDLTRGERAVGSIDYDSASRCHCPEVPES